MPQLQPEYRKDPAHESELERMNALLEPLELEQFAHLKEPRQPTIFVIGAPRSGHTLLGQVMVASFRLAYPTNFIARFWKAPGLGARFQRLALGSAQAGLNAPTDFLSEHGLTRGAYGLHEFSYFWQDVLGFEETHFLEKSEWSRVRGPRLNQAIASLEAESGGVPVLFKNGAQLGLQTLLLAHLLPRSVFVCTRRDPLFVAQSHVLMRDKRFQDRSVWFGVKPPEYPQLKGLPWWEQIAGQVFHFQRRLNEQLTRLDPARLLNVEYSELCKDPASTVGNIKRFLDSRGQPVQPCAAPPEPFVSSDRIRLPAEDIRLLEEAFERLRTGFASS